MLTIRQEISPNGKSGDFYHEGSEVVEFSHCHCEEDRMDDAAIHRVSVDAHLACGSLTENQWIATSFQPSR